jgi:uncharacterized membrane protein HdeD (DUF308 family)
MVIEVLVGLLLGIATIVFARKVHGESWVYSASVISLPLIYVVFALFAGDYPSAVMELLFGAPFIIGGVVCLVFRLPMSAIVIGALWVVHGVFDLMHYQLFVNPGVPEWYPFFCAAVDIVIGGYLIWLASRLRNANLRGV